MITDELESIDSGKNAKKLATEINNILKPGIFIRLIKKLSNFDRIKYFLN